MMTVYFVGARGQLLQSPRIAQLLGNARPGRDGTGVSGTVPG